MTFDEILDQALALLQRRGRLTYRACSASSILMRRTWRTSQPKLFKANAWQSMRTAPCWSGPVAQRLPRRPPHR